MSENIGIRGNIQSKLVSVFFLRSNAVGKKNNERIISLIDM